MGPGAVSQNLKSSIWRNGKEAVCLEKKCTRFHDFLATIKICDHMYRFGESASRTEWNAWMTNTDAEVDSFQVEGQNKHQRRKWVHKRMDFVFKFFLLLILLLARFNNIFYYYSCFRIVIWNFNLCYPTSDFASATLSYQVYM